MEQEVEDVGVILLLFVIFLLFSAWVCFNTSKTKEKIRRKLSDAKKEKHISDDLIIIAVEIADFVVTFSEKYRRNYKLINEKKQGFGTRVLNYLANNFPCYTYRFAPRAIRAFFKELKAIENIKLVLYTKLQR